MMVAGLEALLVVVLDWPPIASAQLVMGGYHSKMRGPNVLTKVANQGDLKMWVEARP